MSIHCVLFYPDGYREDEAMEAALDRELAASSLELLAVSARTREHIPERRRSLPYLPPETVAESATDYVILMGVPRAGGDGTSRKDRLKRFLQGPLLKLARKISMLFLTGRNMRRWKKYSGWGKPIQRRQDMTFPETSPLRRGLARWDNSGIALRKSQDRQR